MRSMSTQLLSHWTKVRVWTTCCQKTWAPCWMTSRGAGACSGSHASHGGRGRANPTLPPPVGSATALQRGHGPKTRGVFCVSFCPPLVPWLPSCTRCRWGSFPDLNLQFPDMASRLEMNGSPSMDEVASSSCTALERARWTLVVLHVVLPIQAPLAVHFTRI